MSFANPTRVRPGMTGSFSGQNYRVVGRSVMGESESGETYYWNEFNLKGDSGKEATLVYEETETGGQWRMFTLFDPEYPMTAADAATKKVGDSLNFTGDNVRVTFRGSSRVYHLEGEGPEDEDVGDVAQYFNAEGGGRMLVISWTGDEVEYYNGVTLTRGMVATAFKLPLEAESPRARIFGPLSGSSSTYGSGSSLSGLGFLIKAGFIIVLFLIIFGRGFSFSRSHEAAPVSKTLAGPAPLAAGATGTVSGKSYRITTHALVEIAEVGAKWERHEYELTAADGGQILLVCGNRPKDSDWIIYEPFTPALPLTATEAAAEKIGDTLYLDGQAGNVSEIFLYTIEQLDGGEASGISPRAPRYGFRCLGEGRPLLARWDQSGIQFFRGQTISAKKAAKFFAAAK